MANDLSGELRTAISSIRNKSAEASQSTFLEDIQSSRVASAKSQISFAQSAVTRNEMLVDNLESKLSPPPTKEIASGKGGTRTVVDQEEVRKLESQKSNAQSELETAKSQVQQAQQEADVATSDALQQAGITKELQSDIEALNAKAESIQSSLGKGEAVSEESIKDLIKGVDRAESQISGPNAALKDAFLSPMEKSLSNILVKVEANPGLVVSAGA